MKRTLTLSLLLFVPVFAAVPTPESHFGHKIGVDNELLDWDKVVTYFQALEKSSDRIKFKELGKTVEGRPQIAVMISSAANIKNLDHYLDIQRRLSDPRKTTPAEAARLEAEGKTIVMITCSIHATEVASTHTAVEFAYRLLTEDNPKFKRFSTTSSFCSSLRRIPMASTSSPAGIARRAARPTTAPIRRSCIITTWATTTIATGTSSPSRKRATPPRSKIKWHPEIVYDVHQMGPNGARLFVPPWMDPVDPNIDPILASICNMIGTGVATDLYAAGKTGIAINGVYDFWSPARQYQAYHGGARILTESASAKLASPITHQARRDRRQRARLQSARAKLELSRCPGWKAPGICATSSTIRRSPGNRCSIRPPPSAPTCCATSTRSIKDNVERATPNAFVIPASQSDPGAAKKMLETLAFGDVEIERAADGFTADGKQFAAGSYVISMHQPFSGWAKTLLEVQDYPDLRLYPGGPPKRPYDVTAQTLPMLMGVDVVDRQGQLQGQLKPVTQYHFDLDHSKPQGGFAGHRRVFLERGRQNLEIGKTGLSRHRHRRFLHRRRQRPQRNSRAAHRHVPKLQPQHG